MRLRAPLARAIRLIAVSFSMFLAALVGATAASNSCLTVNRDWTRVQLSRYGLVVEIRYELSSQPAARPRRPLPIAMLMWRMGMSPPQLERAGSAAGFAWIRYDGAWYVEGPLWAPFVGAVLPAGVALLLIRPRPRPGHCPACGYDLRGLKPPADGRPPTCPECGGPAPRATI